MFTRVAVPSVVFHETSQENVGGMGYQNLYFENSTHKYYTRKQMVLHNY